RRTRRKPTRSDAREPAADIRIASAERASAEGAAREKPRATARTPRRVHVVVYVGPIPVSRPVLAAAVTTAGISAAVATTGIAPLVLATAIAPLVGGSGAATEAASEPASKAAPRT